MWRLTHGRPERRETVRPLKTCTFSRNPPPTRRRSKHKTVQLPKRDVPRYWDAAGTSRHCAHGRHTLSRRNIRRHAPRGSIFRATRMHACAHAGRCLRSFEPYVITRCPCLAPVRCKQNSHRLRAMQPPPAEAPRGMLSRCQAAEEVPAPAPATCLVASAYLPYATQHAQHEGATPRQRYDQLGCASPHHNVLHRKHRELTLGYQYAYVTGSGVRSSAQVSTASAASARAPRGVRTRARVGWRNASDARREALKLVRRPRSRTAARPGIGTDGSTRVGDVRTPLRTGSPVRLV